MGFINKKYLRLVLYSILLVTFLGSFKYVKRVTHNETENINNGDQVIVDVGILQCVHMFSMEICPRILHSTGHSKGTTRKIVRKDLKAKTGSIRLANYIYYDHISKNLAKKDFITGITSDNSDRKQKYDKLAKNIFVTRNGKRDSTIKGIDVLFNVEVDPRLKWNIIDDISLPGNSKWTKLSVYKPNSSKEVLPEIQLGVKGRTNKFKILQLADLHYSTLDGECRDEYPKTEDCNADFKTRTFIESILNLDRPDLVVFTGDQIMGSQCSLDATSALFKVVNPIIRRKIPWTMVWGNHDDEGSLSRVQLSNLAMSLPYSMFRYNPNFDTSDNTFGTGNYIHKIRASDGSPLASLIFLDSHKKATTKTGKVKLGYDWIKESQLNYVKENYGTETPLNMAFFHIPLPEFLNTKSDEGVKNVIVGLFKEGVTAPRYNSGALDVLKSLKVQVVGVGHDHCNDYCLLEKSKKYGTWLCFGGAAGEGGYGGYGGTERRVRLYEINGKDLSIKTWKRLNSKPKEKFEEQLLVQNGVSL
ncbi:hypothetical protein Kpol_472p15 [Vanderwaltozyma polyspora DSM 70294]|uniref:Calcineurin-like phosphoesterase domain-containing protein n=1 Tax=Vanderwaltozyma polyspora (strain ATCC 22028 / DSM 70294 / BCRC 21397 / CBS 2163 / NBRC 10782 / NRRL Y-8283 / UCD 57-17) TaxID=436907 RepID=A7TQI3_VANPO|nr:uncharacterized protein Kpol_472p15 [Vanderwaltozyma polyspora DSM 70294]EDO15484.1 hypothetical protein Kpol_472p15 [Vanderwaltozyma polyspora DSM 70294]